MSNGVNKQKKQRVLLISSSGGHWIQMNRLRSAFREEDLYFACTDEGHRSLMPEGRFYYVPDASRTSGVIKILWQAFCVFVLLLRIRPTTVLTTGAAPGFFALFFAKLLRKRTIWVDSIANVDELSMSGRKAAKYADLFITQWEHLADQETKRPEYHGSVV